VIRRVSTMPREHEAAWQAKLEHAQRTRRRSDVQRLKELRVRLSLPHLGDWGREFFPHYVRLAPSLMHADIIDTLHDFCRSRKVGSKEARIAPRSGAKTTWTSKLFTLYCICHSLEHYILLIGETAGQSHSNLKAIKRELTANAKLRDAYPHICGEGPVWNVDEIITRNDIRVEAAGAGKSIRGTTHGEHRPGLVIVDDLDDRDAVRNDDIRGRMWDWFTETLMPIGDDSTNFLFVGTALHEDDTIHRLRAVGEWGWKRFEALIHEPTNLHLWDQWKRLFLDLDKSKEERLAIAREFYDQHKAEMDAGAVLLWPEREPLYSLMSYRTAYGEKAFQSEKQGNAAMAGNTEFSGDLFGDIWFAEWPRLKLSALALDPSKGKNEKNDFSAFVWGGLGEDGLLYVDADIERRDAVQVVADGLNIYRQFGPMLFGIEVIMLQSLFQDLFHMSAQARGMVLPITPIHSHESKMVRIRQLTPYLTQGRIRFRAGSRGAESLVDQLKKFPLGKHDDGPDALHMMVELLKSLDGQAGQDDYALEVVRP
jgi:predicted phage terminase large subunit-like protein